MTDSVRARGEAWGEPAAWYGTAHAAGIALANDVWDRIALTETVVHGWDLARATGWAYDPDPETLRVCFDHVAASVPHAPVEGLWGPAAEVPAGAPLLDQVVAVTGRRP